MIFSLAVRERMSRRRGMPGMMRHMDLPPWLNTLQKERSVRQMPYALVRISTKAMHTARARIMRSTLIMVRIKLHGVSFSP